MPINLDFGRCRLPPFQHQREDVGALVDHPYYFIASEMRTGKTKIVVDAAQFLFEAGEIDKVIVISPAPVRDVWYDPVLGEIAKHSFVPTRATEYHAKVRTWATGEPTDIRLNWYVSNFEFIRTKSRVMQFLQACGRKTLLVIDESSFVKSPTAQQTKSCMQLRKACGRVVLLNGTPLFHSPLDLFSQGNLLHPSILECKYITHFKARYAVQTPVLTHGGKPLTKIVGVGKAAKEIIIQQTTGWTNLEDLQRRFAPCTVRRLQKDCLDLPEKLDSVPLTAALSPETWRAYKDMRDELVVWLQNGNVAVSATAAVKTMRLSQITSGFLGGVEAANIEPEWILDEQGALACDTSDGGSVDLDSTSTLFEGVGIDESASTADEKKVCEVGREKLDVLLWFIDKRLEEDPNLHLVAWGRFRAEVFRVHDEVAKRFPQFETALIVGGQKKAERLRALSLLKPETSPTGPVFVAGIEGTGSFGLDMCAAHTCITMSSGYSPGRSAQTLDRVYGPGQKYPIAYYSILATGPQGQRTIDHTIEVARRSGADIASWTAAAWITALRSE